MQTTIDQAGRLVVPKELRDRLGLGAGSRVEIWEDGSSLRIEIVAADHVIEVDGRLLVDADVSLTDDDVRDLRRADQR